VVVLEDWALREAKGGEGGEKAAAAVGRAVVAVAVVVVPLPKKDTL
jgi:hypothetical protein